MREKLIEVLEGLFVDYGATAIFFTKGEAEVIADHLIANGVTIATDTNVGDKWISVKDRLPEHEGRYLCNVKSFAFKGAFYITMLKYDKGGFIEGYIYTDDVTHWMPLPQPPKE